VIEMMKRMRRIVRMMSVKVKKRVKITKRPFET